MADRNRETEGQGGDSNTWPQVRSTLKGTLADGTPLSEFEDQHTMTDTGIRRRPVSDTPHRQPEKPMPKEPVAHMVALFRSKTGKELPESDRKTLREALTTSYEPLKHTKALPYKITSDKPVLEIFLKACVDIFKENQAPIISADVSEIKRVWEAEKARRFPNISLR